MTTAKVGLHGFPSHVAKKDRSTAAFNPQALTHPSPRADRLEDRILAVLVSSSRLAMLSTSSRSPALSDMDAMVERSPGKEVDCVPRGWLTATVAGRVVAGRLRDE